MIQYQFQGLRIDIYDDPTFSFGSADNTYKYSQHHFGDNAQDYPVSKHGIKVYNDETEVSSCIILGSGGSTTVHETSLLLDKNKLLLCCCDTLFCLALPDLSLLWQTKADTATCFQVFKLQEDYIVHGELEISRIDEKGQIKWQFSGEDIFLKLEGGDGFELTTDSILLCDFNNKKYKIDFNGKSVYTHF